MAERRAPSASILLIRIASIRVRLQRIVLALPLVVIWTDWNAGIGAVERGLLWIVAVFASVAGVTQVWRSSFICRAAGCH